MERGNERRAAILVFVALFATYAYFFGGTGFGQNAIFSQSRAIVETHSISIDAYLGNTADLSHYAGKTYPNKPPGVAFLAAIPYAAFRAVAGTPADALTLTFAHYVSTAAVSSTAGAAIGALLFLCALRLGTPLSGAFAIAIVAGLGTPLFPYSTMLYLHVPSALFSLLGLAIAARLIRFPLWVAGAAIGVATCMNYLSAFAVVAALPLLLHPAERRWRDAALFAAGGVPFALLLGGYQWAAFGSPLSSSVETTNPAFLTKGAYLGVVEAPRAAALWGITFSPYRGLFYASPFLLLAVFGCVAAARRRELRPLVTATALLFVMLLLFNISFNGWHGGYAFGPRYLIPAVPLLALLVATGRAPRVLFIALATISIVLNFAATAVDPQPPDRLHDPLGKYLLPALLTGRASDDEAVPPWIRTLYTGHTSTNRVASDEMLPFRKHPPGSPANEWASFNLGEMVFGPGSALSLLPLALLWVFFGTLFVREVRREQSRASG